MIYIAQVLITKMKIDISKYDILTLRPDTWINDNIINFYLNMLVERSAHTTNQGLPKVHTFHTFFAPKLMKHGYEGVQKWTKNVDIFCNDLILVPVFIESVHWCMAIINMHSKKISYYDSLGSLNFPLLVALEDYLRNEQLTKCNVEIKAHEWSKEHVTNFPQQENSNDCGVFSCMAAEFVCRNRNITFTQKNVSYFREKMILEIVTGKLLL